MNAVGRVSVTVTDDFSGIDPDFPTGTCILQGNQAITFLRSRKNLGDQLNISRMQRQNQYMEGFLTAFREKNSDAFVLSVYEQVAAYIVTDCSANVISSMMRRYGDYTLAEIVTPEGENRLGQEYYEFYPDEKQLDDLILILFYTPK